MAQVANESLRIANASTNLATRASRVLVARENVRRLKELAQDYPFLWLTTLGAFEASIDQVERETLTLVGSGEADSFAASASARQADPFLQLPLAHQCSALEVPIEVFLLPRVEKRWRWGASNYAKPEEAALAIFAERGFVGTACEGTAPLTIMKCAALDYLARVNKLGRADACLRYFEAQCLIHAHLGHYILEEIAGCTEARLRTNYREVVAQPRYSTLYPAMGEDTLAAIWRTTSPIRWAELAQALINDFDNRAGWPDLTLARGDELRFVEVKTSDRLHASQKAVIGGVLKPWGADVSVFQIKPGPTDASIEPTRSDG
jgi:hypothetical protein